MSIQENGDIRLHGQEGILIVFEFTTDSGAPRSMVGATVLFKTQTYSKPLVAGEAAHQMILQLRASDLTPDFLNRKTPYIILDNSGTVPHVVMNAELVVTGWN